MISLSIYQILTDHPDYPCLVFNSVKVIKRIYQQSGNLKIHLFDKI